LLCRNPYMAPGGLAYGCGQCLPCRINKRREWVHRLLLEATQHPQNSFWTLTYSDDNVPLTEDALGTLEPSHLTAFLKRLRKAYQPLKIRYFYVGEYGDITERPHYHLALFNMPGCLRGITQVDRRGNCCSVCDTVRRIWGYGLVHAGILEANSCTYIAGYVTKKLTSKDDPRLKGRTQEFARMSLKPGIGATFMPEVASAYLSHNLHSTRTDVTTALRQGRSVLPLGRYLTRLLRQHVGMTPNAPPETIQKKMEELRELREKAQEMAPKGLYLETFKSLIIDSNEGKYRQAFARSKRNQKRAVL